MNFQEFQKLAIRTAKPLPFRENLRHVTYGVTGEAGEFADAVKKFDIYGQDLNKDNAKEALGDLLWYIALGAETLGTDMEELAAYCIEKLKKRYPDQYSDQLAEARLDKASQQ